jgi:hypothetical protein
MFARPVANRREGQGRAGRGQARPQNIPPGLEDFF